MYLKNLSKAKMYTVAISFCVSILRLKPRMKIPPKKFLHEEEN
jgi:hypothetical protein